MSRSRGFTLIEILVVIFILGILSTLVVGGITIATKRSQLSTAQLVVGKLDTALEKYITDEGRYPGQSELGRFETNRNYFPLY